MEITSSVDEHLRTSHTESDRFQEMADQAQQTSSTKVVTLSSKEGDISSVESFNLNIDLEAIQPNEKNGELTREKLIESVRHSKEPSFIRTQVYAPRNSDAHIIGESQVTIRMAKNLMKEENFSCLGFAQLPMDVTSPHILPKPKKQVAVPTFAEWEHPDLNQFFTIDLWIPKKRMQGDVKSIQANFTLETNPVEWKRAPYGHEDSPFMLTRLFKSESIIFKRT